jgi:hypothetical protein
MPPSPDRHPFRHIGLLALGLALLGAGSMVYYHLGLFIPRVLEVRAARGLGNGFSFGDDFYPLWLTSRLARTGERDLYCQEITRKIQTGLFGRPLDASNPADPPADYRTFAYPAFADLLLWPTTLVGFPMLRVVLAVLLPLLTAVSIWLWLFALRWPMRPLGFTILLVLALCNYSILEAFFALQPGLIVGFLLACGIAALTRGRFLVAGILLSLTLIKPQMTLLVIAYLLLWSVSRKGGATFWAGFSGTTLALFGASLWLSPHWVGEWVAVISGYHRYATPSLASLLPGNILGGYLGSFAIIALLAVGAVVAWRGRLANSDSPDFWVTLSLLLAITSLTMLPGQAIYDHVILFPGILLIVRKTRQFLAAGRLPRSLLAIGTVVLFWPWVAAIVVVAIHPFLNPELFYSNAVFALPIRTAASLPFAVLALLFCIVRVNALRNQESA